MSDLINLVFEETIEMSFEEERQRIFNMIRHEFTDNEIRADIDHIYETNFHGWNPERKIWRACRVVWTNEPLTRGCDYIPHHMTRSMTNDWWYSEFVRYYILKLYEKTMSVNTDIDEWAEHVFPPPYDWYEEEFEEDEPDDPEPSNWNVDDRELSYPRHHLQRHD